ncbi:hypothetical protein AB7M50_008861 [Bradyrhizobium elkanii]
MENADADESIRRRTPAPAPSAITPWRLTWAPFASTVPPAALTALLLAKATLETVGDCIWNVPPLSVMVPVPTESAFVTCTVPAEISVPPE